MVITRIAALLILVLAMVRMADRQRPVADCSEPILIRDTIRYYPFHKVLVDVDGRCYLEASCPDNYK